MQRAVDAAILELGALNDRDRILDSFFEYASSLFEFSVLFLVKGDVAHGRNVNGLGAPPGLVGRVALSLNEPGMLATAWKNRRAALAVGPPEDADRRLFGFLGRALPTPFVLPLVVRDRVVAIFIGETATALVGQRAAAEGRKPMQIVRDELVLLSEATGQVLERLILRKKTESMPPPANPSGAPFGLPAIPRAPAPPAFAGTSGTSAPPSPVTPSMIPRMQPIPLPPERKASLWPAIAAGVLLVAGGLTAILLFTGDSRASHKDIPGSALPGWPNVEPMSVLETARKASEIGARAELALIEAEVGDDGRVDFKATPKNPSGVFMRFAFVTDDVQSEVPVDTGGLHAGRVERREKCGEVMCRRSVPMPTCTIASLLDGARAAGLEPGDRPLLRYPSSDSESGAPQWLLGVAGRGTIRIDGTSCKPVAREKLRPNALPVEKIPGAPSNVDPLAIVPLALTQSGLSDASLLEMDAVGVTESGRVDLNVADAVIHYVFAEPVGQQRRRWRRVSVRRNGMPVATDDGDVTPLPVRLFGLMTPAPRCTLPRAREYLTLGSPAPGPARMTFGPGIGGGDTAVWSIESPTLPARKVASDGECAAWSSNAAGGSGPTATKKK